MLDSIRDKELYWKLSRPPKLPPEERIEILRETAQRLKFKVLQPWQKAGVTFDEAFLLGMYAENIPQEELARYVGRKRQTKFHQICNDVTWYASANDKALYYTILQGAGIATPQSLAFIGSKRRAGFGEWLGSPERLAEFFGSNSHWPLFIKPVDGSYSLGALKLTGFDGEMVQVFDDDPVRVPELWHYILGMSANGYVVQSFLNPSAFSQTYFGDGLASVRLLILFSGSEPQLESAVIKIPSGKHAADNFWRSGNMLASLSEDGHIQRVIAGKGRQQKLIETHPATGVSLVGLQLPDWQGLCDLALKAACLFPNIRTQSWDVALTDTGPMLLELNYGGDLDLHQIAHQRGILSSSFVAHLLACGVKLKGV